MASDGLRSWCKDCWNSYQRERWSSGQTDRAGKLARDRAWRKANPERQAEIQRNSLRRRKYGIEPVDYVRMNSDQGGACLVCRDVTALVVDHDHTTGAVRGLLCSPCNLALGHVGDDPGRLLAVAAYLLRRVDVLSIGASA